MPEDQQEMKSKDLTLRDRLAIARTNLAIDRTRLSNENTALAYLRTALALIVGGIALIRFFGHVLIGFFGWLCIAGGLILVVTGIIRFRFMCRKLKAEDCEDSEITR